MILYTILDGTKIAGYADDDARYIFRDTPSDVVNSLETSPVNQFKQFSNNQKRQTLISVTYS